MNYPAEWVGAAGFALCLAASFLLFKRPRSLLVVLVWAAACFILFGLLGAAGFLVAAAYYASRPAAGKS